MARNVISDYTLADGVNSIANANQLWQLRRDHDNSFTRIGKLIDNLINLILSANINSSRWLIERTDAYEENDDDDEMIDEDS